MNHTEIKVRGYHADFYGHVNNARYLEFLEEDRWARLESNLDLQKWATEGLSFIVVNININYRKLVMVGDTVLVKTRLEQINNRSIVLKQEVLNKKTNDVAADALITFVICDKNGKTLDITGDIRNDIELLRGRS